MQKHDNRPIGIFDSGVGGLTVLTQIKKALPNESLIYVGDTANAPYGGKTPEELLKHARDIIHFLQSQNVKAVVLACGTTSSTVYEQLSCENPDIPLIDVIRPGAEYCIGLTSQTTQAAVPHSTCTSNIAPPRLGLIATAATIKSGLFAKLVKAQRPDIQLLTQACPLFAPMAEAGQAHSKAATWAAETYIGHWRGKIDALILGCTHYPLLENALTHALGQDMQYINLATHTAQSLKAQLANNLNSGATPPQHKFYVSGNPTDFNKTARFILNHAPEAEKLPPIY